MKILTRQKTQTINVREKSMLYSSNDQARKKCATWQPCWQKNWSNDGDSVVGKRGKRREKKKEGEKE